MREVGVVWWEGGHGDRNGIHTSRGKWWCNMCNG